MSFDPEAEGWRPMPRAALPGGLGVPWSKRIDGVWFDAKFKGTLSTNWTAVAAEPDASVVVDRVAVTFDGWPVRVRATAAGKVVPAVGLMVTEKVATDPG